MKAFMTFIALHSVLCVVVFLHFNESILTMVVGSLHKHCTYDEKECKSFSNFQVNLQASLARKSTTIIPTTRPTFSEWIGSEGYKTYSSGKTLQRQCKSCSIVNNAGRLLGSKVGNIIDKADCVIRMNSAPIDKYKDDVGSRTTFRVIGHRNLPRMIKTDQDRSRYLDDNSTRSDLVIVWHYGWNIEKKALDKFCKANCLTRDHAAVYLSGKEVMKRNENMFNKELNITKSGITFWMSTGWGTMLFALDVCQTIDVYGMIYEDYCSEHPNDTRPYHYYDTETKLECAYYLKSEVSLRHGHKYFTEKAVFAKWANMYNIHFHEPSWSGHLEGYNSDTVIDSLFHRTFWENERKKMANKRPENDLSGTRNKTEAQLKNNGTLKGLPSNRTLDATRS